MDVIDIARPAIEPVSLARAKLFLRVDHDAEDDLISDMITAARIHVETFCGTSLISRQRRITLSLEGGETIINHHPIQSVDAVRLIEMNAAAEALTASQYTVNLRTQPARFYLKPAASKANFCTAEIDITAGYGESEDDIPAPFSQAILLLTAQFYERGAARPDDLPLIVQALLMPYRGLRL